MTFPPALDADRLAQACLTALDTAPGQALALAAVLQQCFPEVVEGHLLEAATHWRRDAPAQAVAAMVRAMELEPLQGRWRDQAIAWAVDAGDDDAVNGLLPWVERHFLAPPSVAVLDRLTAWGWQGMGAVGVHGGALRAWTWLPAGCRPHLETVDGPSVTDVTAEAQAGQHGVRTVITAQLPAADGMYFVRLTDGMGRHAVGSPVACASPAIASHGRVFADDGHPVVLVPVFAQRRLTMRCLAALLASRRWCATPFHVLVVWDHGPDRVLLDQLGRLARQQRIALVATPCNLGFLAAVNHGLGFCQGHDVVLLNSDTLVAGDWLDRLRATAHRPRAGTVTPLGSAAELLSFPSREAPMPVTGLRATQRLHEAAARCWPQSQVLEIPVGVGFCLYIRQEVLQTLGGFDGLALFSGYGEEVDLCLRARQAGWRNLAAPDVFVAHVGGQSFGAAKQVLAAQNNALLFRRYPGYREEYRRFLAIHPLRAHMGRMTEVLLEPVPELLVSTPAAWALLPLWARQELARRCAVHLVCTGQRATLQRESWAPIDFRLPRDARRLRRILARIAPSRVTVVGRDVPWAWLPRRCGTVGLVLGALPPAWRRAWAAGEPCPRASWPTDVLLHCPVPDLQPWLDAAGVAVESWPVPSQPAAVWDAAAALSCVLVPPPSGPAGWERLACAARAAARQGTAFCVPDWETTWQGAPRPANVLPAFLEDTGQRPSWLEGVAVVDDDPLALALWGEAARRWGCPLWRVA